LGAVSLDQRKRRHEGTKGLLHRRTLTKTVPTAIPDDAYVGGPRTIDGDKVFIPGEDSITQILDLMTQFDDSDKTVSDEDRCGAAIAVAAAINAGTLPKLITYAKKKTRKRATKNAYDSLAKKWRKKTIKWGDIGKLQQMIFKDFEFINNGRRENTMIGADLFNLMKDGAQITPPTLQQRKAAFQMLSRSFVDVFESKMSWPFLLHFPTDSEDDKLSIHWVLIGKSGSKNFIYDPYTMRNHGALFLEGDPNYEVYSTWILDSALPGSGWSPATPEDAAQDREVEKTLVPQ
jgi:hypothetical protein